MRFMFAVVVGLLLISMLMCGTAAYAGYGIRHVGPRHLRSGSINGPQVVGGGPGAGK